MTTHTPPQWAEAVLQLVVKPSEFPNVSGDLLEEYRETAVEARGRWGADAWYVWQVGGFVWRSAGVWAALLACAFLVRTALDWRVPPASFDVRAAFSTYFGLSVLLVAGYLGARRAGSVAAGCLTGVAVTALAAALSILGAAVLLVLWHDTATLAAIDRSGGLDEVFTLPIVHVLPGAVFGTIGGLARSVVARL